VKHRSGWSAASAGRTSRRRVPIGSPKLLFSEHDRWQALVSNINFNLDLA